MDPFIVDWLNLLLRWGHLIAGIAWIGTSFYFVALDFSLKNHSGLPPGVAGEAWEVHGGGFYHVRKYAVAPAELPDDLIWYKWEAYLTWVTGFFLLSVQYYLNASTFLIDPNVMALAPWQAIAISASSLIVGWAAYDTLCRPPLGDKTELLAVLVFLMIVAAAYGFANVFSGRGALIHVGAFIGTIMAANVFLVIIPNQKKITSALLRGETPDPRLGATGKQRSLHNTYLTLPVLLTMISNHYPMIADHPNSWAIVGLIVIGGGVLRYFLVRHEVGDPPEKIAWAVPVIGAVLATAIFATEPPPRVAFQGQVSDQEALSIVSNHCVSCHAAAPTDPTIKQTPKGVRLETIDDLKRYAAQIEVQTVNSKAMPLGNKTGMTDDERAKIGAWISEL